jgi:hypothetical protein
MLSRWKAGLISSLLLLLPAISNAVEMERVEYSGIELLDTGRLAAGSYLRAGDVYSDSLLEMELQRLDSLYFGIGYPGAVIRAGKKRAEEGYLIDISVTEGDQARLGEIKISGDFPGDRGNGIHDLREGDRFSPLVIGEAMNTTLSTMTRSGYPYAQVWVTGFRYGYDSNLVEISFSVVTGEEMVASDIVFEGISHTDSSTALLASGFIFTFHFFNVHFRIEKFPMDTVVFSGKLSRAELVEERGQWYDRLFNSGELESLRGGDEWEGWRPIAKTFGFLAFGTGILLALGIFGAMIVRLVVN